MPTSLTNKSLCVLSKFVTDHIFLGLVRVHQDQTIAGLHPLPTTTTSTHSAQGPHRNPHAYPRISYCCWSHQSSIFIVYLVRPDQTSHVVLLIMYLTKTWQTLSRPVSHWRHWMYQGAGWLPSDPLPELFCLCIDHSSVFWKVKESFRRSKSAHVPNMIV